MLVQFSPSAVRDEAIQLWTSNALVNELGNQRIIPRPKESKLQDGGFLYTFSSADNSNSAQFALQPMKVGLHLLTLRLNGNTLVLRVFVVP